MDLSKTSSRGEAGSARRLWALGWALERAIFFWRLAVYILFVVSARRAVTPHGTTRRPGKVQRDCRAFELLNLP